MRIPPLRLLRYLPPLLVVALLSGAALVACDDDENAVNDQSQGFVDVTAREAFDLIAENSDNPDFIILDIRTMPEFEAGHIPNAIRLDFYSESFRQDLDRLDKDKAYLLYCRSGNRSGQTLPIMRDLGFTEVYHLPEGFTGWNEQGFPVVSGSDTAEVMAYV